MKTFTFSIFLFCSVELKISEQQGTPATTTAATVSLTNPVLTSWKKSTGGTKTYSGITYDSDITGISYTTTGGVGYVYVQGQGIPSYSVGPWTANPNQPSGQNWVYKFPTTPSPNNGTLVSLLLSLGQMGAFTNGIAIYGPWDAYTYGEWHRNALYFEGISFDQCFGHPDG